MRRSGSAAALPLRQAEASVQTRLSRRVVLVHSERLARGWPDARNHAGSGSHHEWRGPDSNRGHHDFQASGAARRRTKVLHVRGFHEWAAGRTAAFGGRLQRFRSRVRRRGQLARVERCRGLGCTVAQRRGRASWVRCICGGCCLLGRGGRAALQRGSRPGGRRHERGSLEPVCLWCARGGHCPQGRRSRLDPLISGGGRGVKRSPSGPSLASCEAVLLTPTDVGASRSVRRSGRAAHEAATARSGQRAPDSNLERHHEFGWLEKVPGSECCGAGWGLRGVSVPIGGGSRVAPSGLRASAARLGAGASELVVVARTLRRVMFGFRRWQLGKVAGRGRRGRRRGREALRCGSVGGGVVWRRRRGRRRGCGGWCGRTRSV